MKSRGFTLLEVMIALAILGMSLTVLLQAQASSLSKAGRSRDLTVATILARSKIIDIEKHLFHDGFQTSTEEEDGDFHDEGHPEVHFKWRVSEVELDLTALSNLCGGFAKRVGGGKDEEGNGAGACESIMSTIGAVAGSFIDDMGRSMRVVDLQITWADGKYKPAFNVRALLSQDDFSTAAQGDLQKSQDQLNQGQTPGATGTGTTGSTTGAAPARGF